MNVDSVSSLSWRNGTALLLALVLGVASGPLIVTRGFGIFPSISTLAYGAFVYWFLCVIACPAVVCFVSDRWHFLLASLSSLALSASLGYESFRWLEMTHGSGAWAYMKKDIQLDVTMAAVAFGLSLLIAYGIKRIQKA